MQVMLCQSDLILLHKWGLDDSQSHTTVFRQFYYHQLRFIIDRLQNQ